MRRTARLILWVPALAALFTLARSGRAEVVSASCRDECARAAKAEQFDRPAGHDDTGPFDPAPMVAACEESCARYEAACNGPHGGRCRLDAGPPLYQVLKDKPEVHLGDGFHAIVETCTHLSTELTVLVRPPRRP